MNDFAVGSAKSVCSPLQPDAAPSDGKAEIKAPLKYLQYLYLNRLLIIIMYT